MCRPGIETSGRQRKMSANLSRRGFLAAAGAAPLALVSAGAAAAPGRRPVVRPAALKPGDTIGVVAPAGAIFPDQPVELALETMAALGFKVRPSRHLRARWGHFAGTDAQRAEAVNEMFADPEVKGIFALTGGSGCTRLLDRLDYAVIARQPKFFGGFSDLTALLNAIQARTGLVTFHSPTASSAWNKYSRDGFFAMVQGGEALTLRNPVASEDLPVQKKFRFRTLRPGLARGPLLGGNLTVLATLCGTPYAPDYDGAILFLEDTNEHLYRVDRTLAHLRQSGVFRRLAGVVLGQFTDCSPGEGHGTLTLEEILADYFGGLGIPVYSGAQFGHVAEKMTLPVGLEVELDATQGTLRLLQPAVA